MIKITYSIFGICGLLLGLLTMIKGGFSHHGIFINLAESKYSVGSIFIIIGIFFFYIALRHNNKDR